MIDIIIDVVAFSARNLTSRVNASNTIIDDVTEDSHTFLLVYGLSILLLVILADAFNVSYMMFSTVAGKYLHKNMFAKVIRSPLSFFEKNPAGLYCLAIIISS